MFYVLKTHNKDTAQFWGMTAIGVFPNERKAMAFCNAEMLKSDIKIKLVVVKALTLFEVNSVTVNYSKVKIARLKK